MPETFYDVLDVGSGATTEEIERAYRAKVKETHPDVSDNPDADERFKLVQRAREVLTDEAERDRYDRLGHETYLRREDNPFETTGSTGTGDDGADDPSDGASDGTAAGSSGTDEGSSASSQAGDPFDPSDWENTEAATGADVGGAETDGFGNTGAGPSEWNQSRSGSGGSRGNRATSGYETSAEFREQSFDPLRVPLTPRTIIQITVMFVFYPLFVGASILPAFPTTVNIVVGLCTILIVVYLMSLPEVAIVVFGAWGILTPILLVALPSLSVVSLFGFIALFATWFPLGLAFVTRMALRT